MSAEVFGEHVDAETVSQAFEDQLAADEAFAFEQDVAKSVRQMLVRAAAAERIRQSEKVLLDLPTVHLLSDFLAQPDDSAPFVIDGLLQAGDRGIIAAQYKAGKTTMLGNLIRSLVDGDPFLGKFEVVRRTPVTLIDNEMSESTMRRWLRDQGIQNDDLVRVVSLRGRVGTFNILEADVRAEWAALLHDPGIVLFDCLRPVLDALGLDENHDAGRFTVAFDAFLYEAGATGAMLVHHMGHSGERSRGDSRLQDWPDVTWKLIRETPDDPASLRYFTAFGRDVNVSESSLAFDPETRHLTIGEGNRRDVRVVSLVQEVVKQVTDFPGKSKTVIRDMIRGDRGAIGSAIDSAVDQGLIEARPRSGRGGGFAYFPNPSEPV